MGILDRLWVHPVVVRVLWLTALLGLLAATASVFILEAFFGFPTG
jgi:hypothetical protein